MTDTTNADNSDSLAGTNIVVLERCVRRDSDAQQRCNFLKRKVLQI
jgi:hypothetical protein